MISRNPTTYLFNIHDVGVFGKIKRDRERERERKEREREKREREEIMEIAIGRRQR